MRKHSTDNQSLQQPASHTSKLQETTNTLKWEFDQLKRSEQDLREKSDFLNTLLETISNPVFYKDIQGRYTGCNKAFEDFIGCSRAGSIMNGRLKDTTEY